MSDYLIILDILTEVLEGKNLNESFTSHIAGSEANISKIKDICYGVCRNYHILASIINGLVTKKPEGQLFEILLIGIYEINYSKKPEHALVNELVNLAIEVSSNEKMKNFINAVLRNYLRTREDILEAIKQKSEYRYNCPIWLISKLKKEYPKKYSEIIEYSNLIPKIALRVNVAKITLSDYLIILKESGIEADLIDNKIVLKNLIKVSSIPLFAEGYVSVQDISAQKLIDLIKPDKGAYVLDACSAPGGKACQLLENSTINLLGLDIDQSRLKLVQQNLDRLGLTAKLLKADAAKPDWWNKQPFDMIIADVPCSSSGTLKRNPDIKLHRQLADINNFVVTQRNIVNNLWQMLKPGGKFVYITCSIFKEENHDNIEFFCQKFSDIKIVKELNILPTEFADGFYYCILEKQATLSVNVREKLKLKK